MFIKKGVFKSVSCLIMCLFLFIGGMFMNGCSNASLKKITAAADFVLEVESGREVRILQLSDTQIIDSSQQRSENRLSGSEKNAWAPENMQSLLFDYIAKAVNDAKPDLIVIAGDIIYGEFDDSGSSLTALIEHMDSYEIPWAVTFGNHDNESKKGVDWQCEQLEKSEHCLFKRGDVTGNSNYNIAIVQQKRLKRVIYLLDSNGCTNNPDINFAKVKPVQGFNTDQIEWMTESYKKISAASKIQAPTSLFFHIPDYIFFEAAVEAGYQTQAQDLYTIGSTIAAKNGDFGRKGEAYSGIRYGGGLLPVLKEINSDSVFAGHYHKVNTSVLYEGIRFTFGLKTGKYDSHNSADLGGTLMTFDSDSLDIRHLYH